MNKEDYQLEEMENSAVNKSAMAKRAAAGAGLLAAGAATAYGAEQLINNDEPVAEPTTVEQPDLTSGATAGAVEEGVAEQAQPEPQTVHTEENVHVYHHYVDDTPQPQPEPEPEMEFETSTHLYDDEGNLVGSIDTGTYAGKDFLILDEDADGHGDKLWYDENGDGKIQQNEVSNIAGSGYAMGSRGGEHHDMNIETGEEIAYAHENGAHRDDLADIQNDFHDEKSGEEYTGDLAQNNPDYNNNGNVDQYRAEGETSSDEPVLEEETDYQTGEHYADYHEDIGSEEYNADPTEEPILAEDDTLLEDDSTEEYALSEEEPTEDTSSESDMAYNDEDEIENDIDDTADEDLAYNDDNDNDNDVDDTAQYDIV